MEIDLKNKLSELKERRNDLCKLMSGKRRIIDSQYKMIIESKDENRKKSIQNKIYQIYNEIDMIEEKINEMDKLILSVEMYDWNLISTDNEIDLYKVDGEISGTYFIYLHNEPIEAGMISYEPKYSNSCYGDISYSIYSEYQGHNYAFKALCMLSKHLEANGIESLRISVKDDNIPSIKTVQKYEKVNPNKKVTRLDNDAILFDFNFKKKVFKKLLNRKKMIDL